ncbi:hypothetical protein RO07_12510 [Pandoraea pulmonicola]|nr:hypothetical protein RO07_12510 [Pandoraea pulmonicola]
MPPSDPDTRENARVTIDFPVAPDELQLHTRSIHRLNGAGCASGLIGLLCTVLGVAGFAGGAYLCLDAASEVDEGVGEKSNLWVAYAAGGTMVGAAVLSISAGLHQVCACLDKRRQATNAVRSLSLSAHYATTEGRGHDFV